MPYEPSDHPRSVRIMFPILRVLAYFLCLFFAAPLWVTNKKAVPRKGSLLIISNHLSNTDPMIVQYASPRLLHFLSRKELLDMGALGALVKWFRAIPIKQSSADKGAIKRAIEFLKRGDAVGIFPEGQLSPDGKLIELFEGTALIVRLAQTPCICVGLKNTNKMMPSPKVLPQWAFATIEARWGEVRKFDKESSTEEIMGWIESELRRLTDQ